MVYSVGKCLKINWPSQFLVCFRWTISWSSCTARYGFRYIVLLCATYCYRCFPLLEIWIIRFSTYAWISYEWLLTASLRIISLEIFLLSTKMFQINQQFFSIVFRTLKAKRTSMIMIEYKEKNNPNIDLQADDSGSGWYSLQCAVRLPNRHQPENHFVFCFLQISGVHCSQDCLDEKIVFI